jgi:uncharacterized membrane protein YvbJ
MYCPECGNEIKEQNFCPECGKVIETETPINKKISNEVIKNSLASKREKAIKNPKPAPKVSRKEILIAFILILLIAGIGVLGGAFFQMFKG